MKLKEKIRVAYQYLMESDQISLTKKKELEKIYLSLNPAQLKRTIEAKLDNLYKVYQQKQRSAEADPSKD